MLTICNALIPIKQVHLFDILRRHLDRGGIIIIALTTVIRIKINTQINVEISYRHKNVTHFRNSVCMFIMLFDWQYHGCSPVLQRKQG